MIFENRKKPVERTTPPPTWTNRFKVGDAVRTVGGSGAYGYGRITENAGYYEVDYGLGYPARIREENLERFDEKVPLSRPPRSFSPPRLPWLG